MNSRSEVVIPAPDYASIAEQIVGITDRGREAGLDQETIRVMLHTFAQAVGAGQSGVGVLSQVSRSTPF